MPLRKIAHIAFLVLTAVNGLLCFGMLIDLLHRYVGDLGYLLWIAAAPLLSPALLALPWFSAWVYDTAVSDEIILLWGLWIGALCTFALYAGAAARFGKLRKPKG